MGAKRGDGAEVLFFWQIIGSMYGMFTYLIEFYGTFVSRCLYTHQSHGSHGQNEE